MSEPDVRDLLARVAELVPRDLSSPDIDQFRERRRRRRMNIGAVALAVAVVCVVAASAALVSPRSEHDSRPAATDPPIGRDTSPNRTDKHRRIDLTNGYVRVDARPAGVHPLLGWVLQSELNDPTPKTPQQAITWQRNRGAISQVVPAYNEPREPHHVIGVFYINGNSAALTCSDRDGTAFVVHPAPRTAGASNPVEAALAVYARYGLAGYDASPASWKATHTGATTAIVESGTVTLHAVRLRNGTWVIDAGQHCSR